MWISLPLIIIKFYAQIKVSLALREFTFYKVTIVNLFKNSYYAKRKKINVMLFVPTTSGNMQDFFSLKLLEQFPIKTSFYFTRTFTVMLCSCSSCASWLPLIFISVMYYYSVLKMTINIFPKPLTQNEKKDISNTKPCAYYVTPRSMKDHQWIIIISQVFNQGDAIVCNRAKNANFFSFSVWYYHTVRYFP